MGRHHNPRERYTSSHWGLAPKWKKRLDHPLAAETAELVQMGWLESLSFVDASGKERSVPLADKKGHVAFSTDRWEHLYLFVTPQTRARLRRVEGEAVPLRQIAREIGGRFATFPYPKDFMAIPIGWAEHIIYRTEKKGDGFSRYQHQFGEESGIRPIVCIDDRGNLLLVGGNYTVPDAGITD